MTDGFWFETDPRYCMTSFEKALTRISPHMLSILDIVYLISCNRDHIILAWFNGNGLDDYIRKEQMWDLRDEDDKYVYNIHDKPYEVFAMVGNSHSCPITFNDRQINPMYIDSEPNLLITFARAHINSVNMGDFISCSRLFKQLHYVEHIQHTPTNTQFTSKLSGNVLNYPSLTMCSIVKLIPLGG